MELLNYCQDTGNATEKLSATVPLSKTVPGSSARNRLIFLRVTKHRFRATKHTQLVADAVSQLPDLAFCWVANEVSQLTDFFFS